MSNIPTYTGQIFAAINERNGLRAEVAELRHLLSVATEVARERADTIAQMRPLIARAGAFLSLVNYDPIDHALIAEVDSAVTALRAVLPGEQIRARVAELDGAES